jgi:chloramphenicol-sensitive protein RarD
VNWGIFIWAVTSGHIVSASLGYFINPLVSVALGVLLLKEHLGPAQRVAVAIAAAGVIAMTVMLGVVPWVALSLALSFGLYGLMKKRPEAAGPVEGLLVETMTVAAPLVAYLVVVTANGRGSFGSSAGTTTLLVAAGVITVVPLVLFGAAAQRIPLSTVGILQYLAPTLQLIVGITVYDEPMSGAEILGFVMVWIALAVYTADSLRSRRRPLPVVGPVNS